jgi:hypothetical protein
MGAHSLPGQPQRELDLPRSRRCCGNQSGAGDGSAFGIVKRVIRDGRLEIRAVRQIERFGPELKFAVIGEEAHVEIANDRAVQFHESGTDERISAGVAKEIRRHRKRITRRVDVLQGVARIREMRTVSADHTIRNIV